MSDLPYFRVPELPTALVKAGYAKRDDAPRYRQIYNLILDGRIEAEQVNGRYRVARNNLAIVAEVLGLTKNGHTRAAA
jgi:hypothetical protein